jgi:hypothetical protein
MLHTLWTPRANEGGAICTAAWCHQAFLHMPFLNRAAITWWWWWGAGGLHVDMFAHHKSGIAYQDNNRRPETVFN